MIVAHPPSQDPAFPTVFNFLGPLLNPAAPQYNVVGVSDRAMAEVMARCLSRRPGVQALVVHSEDGMDKISPVRNTHSWRVEAGKEPVYRPCPCGAGRVGLRSRGQPQH